MNKYESRWSCEIVIEEKKGTRILDGNFLYIKVISEPIPEDKDDRFGYYNEFGKYLYDVHPFYFFHEDQMRESKDGVYEELVADNEVTRAILDLCSSPEKLDKASPEIWTNYRARLLSFLNSLWV